MLSDSDVFWLGCSGRVYGRLFSRRSKARKVPAALIRRRVPSTQAGSCWLSDKRGYGRNPPDIADSACISVGATEISATSRIAYCRLLRQVVVQ